MVSGRSAAPCTGILLSLLGCLPPGDMSEGAATRVEVWPHAGQEAERTELLAPAERFNASQDSIRVAIAFVPEGSYNAQVQASAVVGRLPDLLELDGPQVAQYGRTPTRSTSRWRARSEPRWTEVAVQAAPPSAAS